MITQQPGKPQRIMVTGAGGQLGAELAHLPKAEGVEIIALNRSDLDVTDSEQCRAVLKKHRPDAIIHCGAYTAVDKAESEPDEAFRVNGAGTRNLAVAASAAGIKLCYISTDYVFDGTGAVPYNEYDLTNPQTAYGKSKLAGEYAVQTMHNRFFIVRTSWVFGKYGNNFVKTMLKMGIERDSLKVVSDQLGSPTYTYDLAHFLLELVQTENYGIYHASNTGICSWHEFAQAIFEERGIKTQVDPCTTDEFPRPAPRPAYSVMDHSAIRSNDFQPLRPWREALQHYLKDSE